MPQASLRLARGNFDPGRLWTHAGGKDSANTISDAGSLMLGHVTAMTLSGHRPTACLSIYVCSCGKQRSVWHVCTVTLFDPCLAMTFQSHRQVQPHVFPSKTSDGSPFGVSHPGNCTESSGDSRLERTISKRCLASNSPTCPTQAGGKFTLHQPLSEAVAFLQKEGVGYDHALVQVVSFFLIRSASIMMKAVFSAWVTDMFSRAVATYCRAARQKK